MTHHDATKVHFVLTGTLCLFLTIALTVPDLYADSYRCGRKLIRTGDSAADVLRVCGEPMYKDSGQRELWHAGQQRKLNVKRWHYRKSPRSLPHVVLLYKGKVVAVETGGR